MVLCHLIVYILISIKGSNSVELQSDQTIDIFQIQTTFAKMPLHTMIILK